MRIIQLRIQVDDAYLEQLVRDATTLGYKRANPEKPWTLAEKVKAARFALEWRLSNIKETATG